MELLACSAVAGDTIAVAIVVYAVVPRERRWKIKHGRVPGMSRYGDETAPVRERGMYQRVVKVYQHVVVISIDNGKPYVNSTSPQ